MAPFLKSRQTVERALKDERRRVLIDHRGAFFATDVRLYQLPFNRGRRQTFVPKMQSEAR